MSGHIKFSGKRLARIGRLTSIQAKAAPLLRMRYQNSILALQNILMRPSHISLYMVGFGLCKSLAAAVVSPAAHRLTQGRYEAA